MKKKIRSQGRRGAEGDDGRAAPSKVNHKFGSLLWRSAKLRIRAAQECSKVANSGHPNVPNLLWHWFEVFSSCLIYSCRERNNYEE